MTKQNIASKFLVETHSNLSTAISEAARVQDSESVATLEGFAEVLFQFALEHGGKANEIRSRSGSTGSNQKTVPDELKTAQHSFYREGDRIVRFGKKKDGITDYRSSFTRDHLNAFISALHVGDVNERFKMHGGLLETLGDDLSRENAYVVKTWLVACGLVKDWKRNSYSVESDSIADNAVLWWDRTPEMPHSLLT